MKKTLKVLSATTAVLTDLVRIPISIAVLTLNVVVSLLDKLQVLLLKTALGEERAKYSHDTAREAYLELFTDLYDKFNG